MKHLLSIDWDYFFNAEPPGDQLGLYDWSHSETHGPRLQSAVWHIRASDFLARGLELPTTTGEEIGFWNGFKFSQGATLHVADSHFQILDPKVRDMVETVTNFDAHHDCGYKGKNLAQIKEWNCGNWGVFYTCCLGADVRVRYPGWRTKTAEKGMSLPKGAVDVAHASAADREPVYDRLFIARSGTWSPPWLDAAFDSFVKACPLYSRKTKLPEPREFHREQAQNMADNIMQMLTTTGEPRCQEKTHSPAEGVKS